MNENQGERGDSGIQGAAGERGPKGDHGQHGEVGATGPAGPREQRFWSWLRLLAFIFVAAVTIFATSRTFKLANDNKQALMQIQENQARIDEEGKERRHQVCLSAEREHLNSVNQLKRTYQYLVTLTPEDAGSSINQAILRQLPTTEEEASTDVAPEFCDVTNPDGSPVGLPEPDPVVPKRPKSIDLMLKDAAAKTRASG
jgi:hypothetical protein